MLILLRRLSCCFTVADCHFQTLSFFILIVIAATGLEIEQKNGHNFYSAGVLFPFRRFVFQLCSSDLLEMKIRKSQSKGAGTVS